MSGCSAPTGVEAVTNAVPSFRGPAVRRAQHTEVALGGLLGVMLIGLAVLIPEIEPCHAWQRVLQNQRGAVVAHAVRRDTDAVICRLRFRLKTL